MTASEGWGCYVQVNYPQKRSSPEPDSHVKHKRVFNIQTGVWTTPQLANAVGEGSSEPGEGRLKREKPGAFTSCGLGIV